MMALLNVHLFLDANLSALKLFLQNLSYSTKTHNAVTKTVPICSKESVNIFSSKISQ